MRRVYPCLVTCPGPLRAAVPVPRTFLMESRFSLNYGFYRRLLGPLRTSLPGTGRGNIGLGIQHLNVLVSYLVLGGWLLAGSG